MGGFSSREFVPGQSKQQCLTYTQVLCSCVDVPFHPLCFVAQYLFCFLAEGNILPLGGPSEGGCLPGDRHGWVRVFVHIPR